MQKAKKKMEKITENSGKMKTDDCFTPTHFSKQINITNKTTNNNKLYIKI